MPEYSPAARARSMSPPGPGSWATASWSRRLDVGAGRQAQRLLGRGVGVGDLAGEVEAEQDLARAHHERNKMWSRRSSRRRFKPEESCAAIRRRTCCTRRPLLPLGRKHWSTAGRSFQIRDRNRDHNQRPGHRCGPESAGGSCAASRDLHLLRAPARPLRRSGFGDDHVGAQLHVGAQCQTARFREAELAATAAVKVDRPVRNTHALSDRFQRLAEELLFALRPGEGLADAINAAAGPEGRGAGRSRFCVRDSGRTPGTRTPARRRGRSTARPMAWRARLWKCITGGQPQTRPRAPPSGPSPRGRRA